MLDRRDRLEKAVLLMLKRQPTGYYNAFQNIARNTRLIYVHGYQSYVWNRAVSERLRRFGRSVLVGDYVVKGEDVDLLEVVEGEEADDQADDDKQEGAVAAVEESKEPAPTEKEAPRRTSPVIEVTEENIGEFTIADVVMPMIGHSIRLPKHPELAQIYTELLLKDGITLDHFTKMTK